MLTQLYRVLAALVVVAAFAHPMAVTAAEPPDAKELVNTLVSDAVSTFAGKKLAPAERGQLFRALLLRYSSTKLVSPVILGRYWQRFSADQQAEFETLLVDYVVAVWGGKLSDMDPGIKIVVQDAVKIEDRVVVQSQMSDSVEPQPVPVEWTVVSGDAGNDVVVDIVADGISLTKTMREDFTALLRATGGNAGPLFDAMRKKIAANPLS